MQRLLRAAEGDFEVNGDQMEEGMIYNARKQSYYQKKIMELKPSITPDEARRVESGMRLQYGTLDHLSTLDFENEINLLLPDVRRDPQSWEDCARSYGL